MPGDSGVLVVTRVRSTNTKCTRGRGCSGHPAFPTPSLGRKINAPLGRIAPRAREAVFDEYERATLSAVITRHRVGASRRPMTGSSGRSKYSRALEVPMRGGDYWIPAFAGMTVDYDEAPCAKT